MEKGKIRMLANLIELNKIEVDFQKNIMGEFLQNFI